MLRAAVAPDAVALEHQRRPTAGRPRRTVARDSRPRSTRRRRRRRSTYACDACCPRRPAVSTTTTSLPSSATSVTAERRRARRRRGGDARRISARRARRCACRTACIPAKSAFMSIGASYASPRSSRYARSTWKTMRSGSVHAGVRAEIDALRGLERRHAGVEAAPRLAAHVHEVVAHLARPSTPQSGPWPGTTTGGRERDDRVERRDPAVERAVPADRRAQAEEHVAGEDDALPREGARSRRPRCAPGRRRCSSTRDAVEVERRGARRSASSAASSSTPVKSQSASFARERRAAPGRSLAAWLAQHLHASRAARVRTLSAHRRWPMISAPAKSWLPQQWSPLWCVLTTRRAGSRQTRA